MRELHDRAGQIVRVLCLILAALVVYQLAGIIIRWNPFRGVTVPELPSLTTTTNSPSEGGHKTNLVVAAVGKGTNGSPKQASTNSAPAGDDLKIRGLANTNPITNSMALAAPVENGTNLAASAKPAATGINTNSASGGRQTAATRQTESAPAGTNVNTSTATNAVGPADELTALQPGTNTNVSTPTNPAAKALAKLEREHGGTNSIPAMLSTNQGTNPVFAAAATGTSATAAAPKKHQPGGRPEMAGMNFNPAQPPGKHGADLPPAVQARIHQITESEILAPLMHPMPMGLLGIAGEFAFLRSANGQTGLVKEGDSLDDLKLLRIGVNRVLIEQDGQKKELLIFSGYGGDSLLPKDSTNENNHL